MSQAPPQPTSLVQFYHRFLDDENVADFIASVSERYALTTLQKLCAWPDRPTRRGALLALSFLGDIRHNEVLGRALSDDDRGVRMIAESGIEELWMRDGTPPQRQLLKRIRRLNAAGETDLSARLANRLVDAAPRIAEAWNQRAIALYLRGNYVAAAKDCRQTLRINPFHYRAMIGCAHCQLEFSDPIGALRSFRAALEVNPNLEAIRSQIRYLAQALEEL
ncbi:MAG: tetratricopeptide repeat protein [Planctomycetales bacterium]|nr:tetratricopeptide repeat protein [Planctomycetales bacterium]